MTKRDREGGQQLHCPLDVILLRVVVRGLPAEPVGLILGEGARAREPLCPRNDSVRACFIYCFDYAFTADDNVAEVLYSSLSWKIGKH